MHITDLLEPDQAISAAQPLGQGIAGFWRLRGRRVFESAGLFWGHYRRSVFISLPFHLQLAPGAGELDGLLCGSRCTCVRFPSLTAPGLPGGMHVCRLPGYGIERVSRKHRSQVCRGLDRCEVRAVGPDELEREGLELNRDTMRRQNRFDPEFGEPRRWRRFVEAVRRTPAIRVTGAYVDARLSAYLVLAREDGWVHMLVKMSRTEDLRHRVNCALDFAVLSEAGRDPSLRAAGNWYVSRSADCGLDRYKREMGFTAVPVNVCAALHPWLAPVATSRIVFLGIDAARSVRPQATLLRSARDLLDTAVLSQAARPPADHRSQSEPGEAPLLPLEGSRGARA